MDSHSIVLCLRKLLPGVHLDYDDVHEILQSTDDFETNIANILLRCSEMNQAELNHQVLCTTLDTEANYINDLFPSLKFSSIREHLEVFKDMTNRAEIVLRIILHTKFLKNKISPVKRTSSKIEVQDNINNNHPVIKVRKLADLKVPDLVPKKQQKQISAPSLKYDFSKLNPPPKMVKVITSSVIQQNRKIAHKAAPMPVKKNAFSHSYVAASRGDQVEIRRLPVTTNTVVRSVPSTRTTLASSTVTSTSTPSCTVTSISSSSSDQKDQLSDVTNYPLSLGMMNFNDMMDQFETDTLIPETYLPVTKDYTVTTTVTNLNNDLRLGTVNDVSHENSENYITPTVIKSETSNLHYPTVSSIDNDAGLEGFTNELPIADYCTVASIDDDQNVVIRNQVSDMRLPISNNYTITSVDSDKNLKQSTSSNNYTVISLHNDRNSNIVKDETPIATLPICDAVNFDIFGNEPFHFTALEFYSSNVENVEVTDEVVEPKVTDEAGFLTSVEDHPNVIEPKANDHSYPLNEARVDTSLKVFDNNISLNDFERQRNSKSNVHSHPLNEARASTPPLNVLNNLHNKTIDRLIISNSMEPKANVHSYPLNEAKTITPPPNVLNSYPLNEARAITPPPNVLNNLNTKIIEAVHIPSTSKQDNTNAESSNFNLIEYIREITNAPVKTIRRYCTMFSVNVHEPPKPDIINMIIDRIFIHNVDSDDEGVNTASEIDELDQDLPIVELDEPKNPATTSTQQPAAKTPTKAEIFSANVELNVDMRLVNSLCSIFPDACPKYVRGLCKGKLMNDVELDSLITHILSANNDYPKRPKPTPEPEVFPEDQLEILKEFLPDADPDYLQRMCDTFAGQPDRVKSFINLAMERRDYPTMKDYQRRQQLSAQQKQYTSEFNVENFVKVIPDPKTFFSDPSRILKLDVNSSHYALVFLRNKFNKLPIRTIQTVFSKHDGKLHAAVKELNNTMTQSNCVMKSIRRPIALPNHIENIPLLQEIAYYTHQIEIDLYLNEQAEKENEERQAAKNNGLLKTCSCCYDEEVLVKDIYCCESNCEFCKFCITKGAEVQFGEGKLDFPCLMNCGSGFSLQTLQAVLSPKLFSKIAQKKALEEIKSAGIEELEMCPFCDFATIPAEGYTIFTCMNPDCMKESCRMCKEPSHVPLRCEEIEKDEHVRARTFVENKMTEALLRTCYKCGVKFFKDEGCNKMTCSCGAQMCYVCGQPVTSYKHFNGNGGDRYDLCPLYSDTNDLNKKNVLTAAEQAKAEVGTTNLMHDPSLDVNQYYQAKKRKYPQDHLLVRPPNIMPEIRVGLIRMMQEVNNQLRHNLQQHRPQ